MIVLRAAMSQKHQLSLCESQTLQGWGEREREKKNPFTNCRNIVTVRSQCVLHCVPCFWLGWRSLLVLLLFWGNTSQANHRLSKPAERDFALLLVVLCDCSPAGGGMAHYGECLGVGMRTALPLNRQLKPVPSAESTCVYISSDSWQIWQALPDSLFATIEVLNFLGNLRYKVHC